MEETRYQRALREQAERAASMTREEERRRRQHKKLQRRLAREGRREKAWADWLTLDQDDDD